MSNGMATYRNEGEELLVLTQDGVKHIPHVAQVHEEPMAHMLTPREFAETMRVLSLMDYQGDKHEYADRLMLNLLIALGYGEGVRIFHDMDKWYA